MQFCNFAAKLTKVNHYENQYYFDILDKECFEINKKYYTLDNTDIEVFFIKDNRIYDILLHGQIIKILRKKRMLYLDYCNALVATNSVFSIKNSKAYDFVEVDLCVGDIIFIRTNLLWKIKKE